MTIPAWPENLPYKPRREDWKISPKLAPIATEMEGGNVRQRARPGDSVRTIDQSLRFTAEEYAIWRAFYDANGTGRISMMVFVDPSVGFVEKTVQITGVQQESADGLKFVVPMTLRVYGG